MSLLLFGIIGIDSVIVISIWYFLFRICYYFTRMKWGLNGETLVSFQYLQYIESCNRKRKLLAAVISGVIVVLICVLIRHLAADAISSSLAAALS